jgi:hypothetical protein
MKGEGGGVVIANRLINYQICQNGDVSNELTERWKRVVSALGWTMD